MPAGLFRIVQPKRFGGEELDFNLLIRAISELARGCGSTGWVYGLSATSQWILALFPPQAQEEIWGGNSTPTSRVRSRPPPSRRRSRAGTEFPERWKLHQRLRQRRWIFVAALLPGGDGERPTPGLLILPRREAPIEDNWHTVGLCGTGSKNVVLAGAFVPAHRTVGFAALSSGAAPEPPCIRIRSIASRSWRSFRSRS